MNKRRLTIVLLSILILGIYIIVPFSVIAADFSTIPFSDPKDDVYRFNGSAPIGVNETGDYHNEIDIVTIFMQGNNLTIEFAAPPQTKANYSYSVQIDNNSDSLKDYWITSAVNVFQLIRTDLRMWNPVGENWIFGSFNLSYTLAGNNLTFEGIGTAIPEIASARINVSAVFLGETPTYYYIDYAPLQNGSNDNTDGIPGFHILFVFFSLLTLTLILYTPKKNTLHVF